jgi:hypothetical protein
VTKDWALLGAQAYRGPGRSPRSKNFLRFRWFLWPTVATENTEVTESVLDRAEGLGAYWRRGVSRARAVIKIQKVSVVSVVSVAKIFCVFCGEKSV